MGMQRPVSVLPHGVTVSELVTATAISVVQAAVPGAVDDGTVAIVREMVDALT
jgi:hypothetical protein